MNTSNMDFFLLERSKMDRGVEIQAGKILKWCQGISPKQERWKIWCRYSDHFPKSCSIIDLTFEGRSLNDRLTNTSERYQEVSMSEIEHYLFTKQDIGDTVEQEDVDDLREQIMQSGYSSFTLDW